MKKVIVVDDSRTTTSALRMALQRVGYSVEVAANGREALELIEAQRPDFLITDIAMPVMDGKELCQALEARMPDRDFPILIISALPREEHLDWVRKIQKSMFLEKPINLQLIIKTLADHFAASET